MPHGRGKRGESLAAEYLARHGYTVVAQNYRYRRSEIDLIVQQKRTLVFVEVKLRKNGAYGPPESFVEPSQADRIITAAEHYLHETDWDGDIRFDVVAITLQPRFNLKHFEDAFY